MDNNKKTIFSGMQPSYLLNLGNYLGALKNWTVLQNEYNCLYCVVDMHAITVRQNPVEFKKFSRDLFIQYVAAGLDPEENIIYMQSHVSGHAELAWILNCFTYMGELSRMTQFKEKSQRFSENINAGLFAYPVLMAADILLYQADLVPVGEDQRQHLELARDIAIRMNNIYGDLFKVPEPYIPKVGSKIMSLQEPDKKMSKSDDNKNNVIYILDDPKVIMNKVKRAVTDSENEIKYSPNKPGVSNLLTIYCSITGKTFAEAEKDFEGFGYGKFKEAVGETIVGCLKPVQQKFKELSEDTEYVDTLIKQNAEQASVIAQKTLLNVHDKIGFVPR